VVFLLTTGEVAELRPRLDASLPRADGWVAEVESALRTRGTSMMIAIRAHSKGWRALKVLPTEGLINQCPATSSDQEAAAGYLTSIWYVRAYTDASASSST